MNEVIIAAIAAGLGSVITIIGKVIVNIIRAKKEPVPKTEEEKWLSLYRTESKRLLEKFSLEMNKKVDNKMNQIMSMINELQDRDKENKEIHIVKLRHSITNIYYQYCDKKVITLNIKSDICSLYEAYKKLGGNSYVHELYDEMMTWKIE